MARRKKDEAEQTKNDIIDAAEKVFYRHGVARTSLEAIAKAAGVTRGAVYWHFRDKIEVCEAMTERVFLPQEDILERLASVASATPLLDLRQACRDSLKLIASDERRQQVISIMMHKCEYVEDMTTLMTRRRECKDRMLEQCQRLFERALEHKQLSPIWPPRVAAIGLQAMMNGLIALALEGRKEFNLATTGVDTIDAFFQSLAV